MEDDYPIGYIHEGKDGRKWQATPGGWVEYKVGANTALSPAFDKTYQESLGRGAAKYDILKTAEAEKAISEGFSNANTAQRAMDAIDSGAKTGVFADARIALGKSPIAGFAGIVPTREDATRLETLRTIQNQGALGDVQHLKGPLSDKDVQFLKEMQVSIGNTPQANRTVAQYQAWVAKRQAAYGRAMQSWKAKLGSVMAPNAKGQTFEAWWGGYANQALPMPRTGVAAAKGGSGGSTYNVGGVSVTVREK